MSVLPALLRTERTQAVGSQALGGSDVPSGGRFFLYMNGFTRLTHPPKGTCAGWPCQRFWESQSWPTTLPGSDGDCFTGGPAGLGLSVGRSGFNITGKKVSEEHPKIEEKV